MREAFGLLGVAGARLVLAGPGDPGPMPDGVEALGAVDHSEVPRLLAGARVAWIPLQRHGNYDRAVPTKLVEAMAAGRPVVATGVGDIPAMVSPDNRPLIVDREDEAAFAAALDTLAQRPDLRRSIGRSNRERAAADYDEMRMIERYAALYGSALADIEALKPD
jgi:glycosyltransferase involved in cell wall biosynthesis